MGESLIEALETRAGQTITRFQTQARSKIAAFDALEIGFSNGWRIVHVEEESIIASELNALRVERTRAGGVTYQSVIHDDAAIACAIAFALSSRAHTAAVSLW
jgi:hypothetical protein